MDNYRSSLSGDALKRYLEKTKIIGDVDPYELDVKDMSEDPENFGKMSYGDMYHYLVFGTSAYTLEDMKAYKSLQAFNQFACGWVKDVRCATIATKKVFRGKVTHSQRLSEKPAEPWLISTCDGEIEAAHCTCMAGLGEVCSHVAAMMFYIEHAVRMTEQKSVTDVAAYWRRAPTTSKVDPSPVQKIDFSTPMRKYERLFEGRNDAPVETSPSARPKRAPTPTEHELEDGLFAPYSKIGVSAAIFSLMPGYVDIVKKPKIVKSLRDLYDEGNEQRSVAELETMVLSLDLAVTKEEAVIIEKDTRSQARSKEWFRHRSGRITASRFKQVCCTNVDNPSMSLVKAICYPETVTFTTKATKWGCKHEKIGRRQYEQLLRKSHQEVRIDLCGLFVNPTYPHFGASPDGLVSCKCCGVGCLEIKCPLCVDLENLEKKSFLTEVGGKLVLKNNHTYYYQVQAQLFICDRKYCDFVVWTKEKILVQRILPCKEFWMEKEAIATNFFGKVVMPEILGKAFTKKNNVPSTQPQKT